MINCLRDPSGANPGAPDWLSVAPDKGWVLLLGDVDVETGVGRSHDVAGSGVQEDVGCVHPAHPDQTHAISATAVNSVTVCVYWHENIVIHCICIQTYFLCAWKEAKVKLFPWYSPKNLLSSSRMWWTSLAAHRRYVRCHWSTEPAPPSLDRDGWPFKNVFLKN